MISRFRHDALNYFYSQCLGLADEGLLWTAAALAAGELDSCPTVMML